MAQQTASGNVLRHELALTVRVAAAAPPGAVFDTLADLSGQPGWGGAEASLLLSVGAPSGPAVAGTEYTSTAEDAVCIIRDSSVVTEASRPRTFEKVTDSRLETKKGGLPAQWLLVHRYDIEPAGDGSLITCTSRLVRANALPGPLAVYGIPVLRRLGMWEWARAGRAGLLRLAAASDRKTRA